MDRNADNLFFQVPRILWAQANAQAQALGETLGSPSSDLLASVNEWRASQYWPLCTDMLPIAPPVCQMQGELSEDTRALWQMGLLQYLKGMETGLGVMRRALVPLCAQSDTWFGEIASVLDVLLVDDICVAYPKATTHCFVLFERLLKTPSAERGLPLWEDIHFYIADTLTLSDAGNASLRVRIQTVANQLAGMLVVKTNEDVIPKKILFPIYLSLMDGLFFLGQDHMVKRLASLYDPLPSQLLKISVPVQKLWAQCLNVSMPGSCV